MLFGAVLSFFFFKFIDAQSTAGLFIAFDILVPLILAVLSLFSYRTNHSEAIKTVSSGESVRVEIEELDPISGEIQLRLPEGSVKFMVLDCSFGFLNALSLDMTFSDEGKAEKRKQITRSLVGKTGDYSADKNQNCSVLIVENRVLKLAQSSKLQALEPEDLSKNLQNPY